jgi:hypothetical protein
MPNLPVLPDLPKTLPPDNLALPRVATRQRVGGGA